MDRYTHLLFDDINLVVSYISDNETMLRYTFPYGHSYLESVALGKQAVSAIDTTLLTIFEQISLYDRVPSIVIVETKRNKEWLKKVISSRAYTQFYGMPEMLHVTLLDTVKPSLAYARHQETLQSFKV